jgi:predicted nucleic acid-binding protein
LPDRAADRVVIDGNAVAGAALVADAFRAWERLTLHAPTLIWSEVSSAVAQMRWRGDITSVQADDAVARLLAMRIQSTPSRELIADALTLARELGWAKTYDAEYVVLAQRLRAPLVTVDARLAARARELVPVLSPHDVARRDFGTNATAIPPFDEVKHMRFEPIDLPASSTDLLRQDRDIR